MSKPRILVLFSDTGGGHRSAAEAVIDALEDRYGNRVSTKMVDVLRDYAPRPLDKLPEWYSQLLKTPPVYQQIYRLLDGNLRTKALNSGIWPYVRQAATDLVDAEPADLIVSFHYVANSAIPRALKVRHLTTPFFTVVTDLVTMSPLWFDRRINLCVVPTRQAAALAAEKGLTADQVKLVGLPVGLDFVYEPKAKASRRRELGWPERPTALLMAGSEGIGPISKIAASVAQADLNLNLIIVTGRNQKLRNQLVAQSLPKPIKVYGYVRPISRLMQASDLILTKAGPSTICEALNTGLPIILYSRVPGQEEGNVNYVIDHGAGIWEPDPAEIAGRLRSWLDRPSELTRIRQAALRLAQPSAATDIAELIAAQIGLKPSR